MKRIISLILGIFILLSAITPFSITVFADGEGTEDNPYIITNESEFNAIRNNPTAYYVLKANVVLPETYIPFEFSGSLVGDKVEEPYSVTVSISAVSSYSSPVGLFTQIRNATIKNIALKGSVSGHAYVGGFFGRTSEQSESVSLENLVNYAAVTGKGTYIGGIGAVADENTEAVKLVNKGYVSGSGFTGGIFGAGYNITACANNGYVSSEGEYAGGIVGEAKGNITECYNSGNIYATGSSGGIIGTVSESGIEADSCFNSGSVYSKTTGINSSGGIVGGIKRLPEVNITIKNSYNIGDVADPCYINSQYIEYDKTNFIKTENCYYFEASDDAVAGLNSFSSVNGLSASLSSAFEDDNTLGLSVLKNIAYAEFTNPSYREEVKEEIEETEKSEEYVKEAEFLKALGATDTITDYEKKVTRGEFADLISRVFLYNIEYSKDETVPLFYDVGPGYAYFDGVKAVSDMGIMTADSLNRFYPDKEITGNEAVTALIRALGYEVYAKANGGYPSGYLFEAKRRKLTENIEGLGSSVITTKTAVKLLYNALFVNTVTLGGVDGNAEETVYIHNDSFYLDFLYRVYKYDVVLTDNGFTNSGEFYTESGCVTVTDFKTGKEKNIKADKDIAPLIGQRLEIYLKEEDGDISEAVYYSVSTGTEITKLPGREITNLTSEGIFYENEDRSEIKKLSFSGSKLPEVYINGSKTTNFKKADFTAENAVVFAINNNNDSYVDFVNVYQYDYEVIAGTISDARTIFPYGESSFDINLRDENAFYTFTCDSESKDFSKIAEKDVIGVVDTGIRHNNKKMYILTVSKNTKEGIYEGYYEDYITIGNEDLLVSKNMKDTYTNYKTDFEYGTEVTVFINSLGEIAFISSQVVDGKNYGYILDAGLTNEFESKGIVKLLEASGTVRNCSISDKVRKENIPVTDFASFIAELKASNDSLIVYEKNDNGEISNVVFAKNATSDEVYNMSNFTERLNIKNSTLYRYATLGGVEVNNTIVFVVPYVYEADGSDSFVQKNYFVYNSSYGGETTGNVKLYDVGQNGVASVALYRPGEVGGKYTTSALTNSYVFKKVTKGFDEKNNAPADIIHYYDSGVLKTVMVDYEADFVSPDSTLPESSAISSLSDLKAGDIFVFELNSDGYAKVIGRILNRDDFGKSGDGIWSTIGNGSTEYKNIQVYEGELQYKTQGALTIRLPIDSYSVRILKYTAGNGVVYKVNKATGSISIENDSEIKMANFLTGAKGDNAVFLASRNNLKGVVIYE